jgi:uncharacterized membrane protein
MMKISPFHIPVRFFLSFSSLVILIFIWSSFVQSEVQPALVIEEEIIEEIEEIEEITVVNPEKSLGLLEILGRFHPAVVHIPIGWLMMVVIIDLVTFAIGWKDWQQWGIYALAGTVLSFFPAIFTGFLNASSLPHDSPILSLMETHRNLNILVTALCIAALVLRFKKRSALKGGVKWIYLGLIFLSAALLALSGHLGGKMVFGVNYLPF